MPKKKLGRRWRHAPQPTISQNPPGGVGAGGVAYKDRARPPPPPGGGDDITTSRILKKILKIAFFQHKYPSQPLYPLKKKRKAGLCCTLSFTIMVQNALRGPTKTIFRENGAIYSPIVRYTLKIPVFNLSHISKGGIIQCRPSKFIPKHIFLCFPTPNGGGGP